MPILRIHVEQAGLNMALGTEEDGGWSDLPKDEVVFMEVKDEIGEGIKDVDKIWLAEAIFSILFLFDCLCDGEVVVVAVGVDYFVNYAKLFV